MSSHSPGWVERFEEGGVPGSAAQRRPAAPPRPEAWRGTSRSQRVPNPLAEAGHISPGADREGSAWPGYDMASLSTPAAPLPVYGTPAAPAPPSPSRASLQASRRANPQARIAAGEWQRQQLEQTAVKKRRRAPAASAARSQARAKSKVARLGSSRADEGPPPPPTSTAAASVGNANGARKRSFQPSLDPKVPPHTLILGTQPSDNSLAAGKYYMTNDNAFWHIVGDGLGFRRGFFVGQRTDVPPSIAPHLLHPPASALGYEDAMRRLTGSGYAVWDIIESSVRKGSLDSNIRAAVYADVRGLVARHVFSKI